MILFGLSGPAIRDSNGTVLENPNSDRQLSCISGRLSLLDVNWMGNSPMGKFVRKYGD